MEESFKRFVDEHLPALLRGDLTETELGDCLDDSRRLGTCGSISPSQTRSRLVSDPAERVRVLTNEPEMVFIQFEAMPTHALLVRDANINPSGRHTYPARKRAFVSADMAIPGIPKTSLDRKTRIPASLEVLESIAYRRRPVPPKPESEGGPALLLTTNYSPLTGATRATNQGRRMRRPYERQYR